MNFRNIVFSIILTVTLIVSSFGLTGTSVFADEKINPVTQESGTNFEGFTDVTKDSFAYDSIMYLGEQGIVEGYGNGLYGLKDNVTRGQVSALIARYLDLDTDTVFDNPYKDVEGDMFEKEILVVSSKGYMKGKGNDNFDPTGVLKRAEMAQVITNVFDLKVKSEEGFWDMDTDHWANRAVKALYSNGITKGMGNNKFNPTGKVTREQYAEFLYRGIHLDEDFEAELIPEQPQGDPNTTFSKTELKRINEINNKWMSLRPTYDGDILDVKPLVTPPYKLGKVNQGALQDAVNATNFVRYLSFLPSNITLNETFNKDAQAAALVNAANGNISHNPKKPNKMDVTLYNRGYSGAGASNLGYGYSSLTSSIIGGYMRDSSDSNRETVGHRRWILSPKLQEVGFGFAVDKYYAGHTAMKVIAENMWNQTETPYQHISWPSETAFPTRFMGISDPWSISLNPDQFDVSKIEDVSVTLTRLNDDKKWKFNDTGVTKDGFFTINTGNYGNTPFTVIIQPTQTKHYEANDRYLVEVNNLYTSSGKKTKFQYETNFFELKK